MSEAAESFHSAVEAVGDWLEKSAMTKRMRSIDPELVLSLVHEIEELRAVVGFYADEDNWRAMPQADYRRKFGTDPISEASFGRMRLRAPGKALPAAVADMGSKARRLLATGDGRPEGDNVSNLRATSQ
jgi:hypothetical protein